MKRARWYTERWLHLLPLDILHCELFFLDSTYRNTSPYFLSQSIFILIFFSFPSTQFPRRQMVGQESHPYAPIYYFLYFLSSLSFFSRLSSQPSIKNIFILFLLFFPHQLFFCSFQFVTYIASFTIIFSHFSLPFLVPPFLPSLPLPSILLLSSQKT